MGFCIAGIDPGVQGGLACYWPSENGLIAQDMSSVDGEIDVESIAGFLRAHRPVALVIERAGAMPKQGVASTFKFGKAYGALRAVPVLLGIPSHVVHPTVWKKHFRLDADKEKARALALRLWPGTGLFSRKKDHGRAEAALLARFGVEGLSLLSQAETAA